MSLVDAFSAPIRERLDLHRRIACALGWELHDVLSYSLLTLRDLVRIEHPKLSIEITAIIRRNGGVL